MLNDGFAVRNWNDKEVEPRQIIILGVPRGGTTMAAGMVKNAGIFIGENLPITLEDREVAKILTPQKSTDNSAVKLDVKLDQSETKQNTKQRKQKGWGFKFISKEVDNIPALKKVIPWQIDEKAFIELANQRDIEHKVWGFKFIYRIHFSLLETLKNPYYIIVFRDIFSVALRNHMTVGSDYLTSMNATLGLQAKILDFIEQTKNPTFLFSYEKAVLMPRKVSKAMLNFLHVPITEKKLNAVAKDIAPSQKDYVQYMNRPYAKGVQVNVVSKIFQGFIDQANNKHVKGWVFFKADPNQEVKLELYFANKLINQQIANLMREGVAKKFSSSGKHGFHFELPQDNQIVDYRLFAVTQDIREEFAKIKTKAED